MVSPVSSASLPGASGPCRLSSDSICESLAPTPTRPVAAVALQRAGIAATVHEAREQTADDLGAFLTLQVDGTDALRTLGIGHVLAGFGFATPRMRFRSGSGRALGEVGTDVAVARWPGQRITLRCADPYRAVRDEAVRRGVVIEHGRRLADVRPVPGGVRAEFTEGETATADLLVGADGTRPRVRQVIDPSAEPARYVPGLNMRGYAPAQDVGAAPGEFEMVFGKRAFFAFAVAPDGAVWWFANPPRRTEPAPGELAAPTTEHWCSRLRELFAGDRTPARAIIDSHPASWRRERPTTCRRCVAGTGNE